ncbi:MAG: hypothetical protein ACKV2Q_18625 [Planctomycetaceae bacterium]
MRLATFHERLFWQLTLGLTVVMEIATIAMRIAFGQSAAEYIAATEPPFLMQIHHMFWSLPFVLVGMAVNERRMSWMLWSVSLGLIASDLLHHFLVLPLWVGNTGWHWP